MTTAIWWIRRDLRLVDNQAVNSALESADYILPLFILDERLLSSPYVGEKRLSFLFAGLHNLDQNLRRKGGCLILRQGDPLEVLRELTNEHNVGGIYAEPDYSPYALHRDESLSSQLPINWIGSPVMHPPGTVLKKSGDPFVVYTPFRNAWKSLPTPSLGLRFVAPEHIPTPESVDSLRIPEPTEAHILNIFPAGEDEAFKRLNAFTTSLEQDNRSNEEAHIYEYSSARNRPDLDSTSRLSPYLRFGMISVRQAFAAAYLSLQRANSDKARKAAETWLNELIWREFYIHILYHFPEVRKANFRMKEIEWENDSEKFEAWCAGETGYPIVDAAMRQLKSIGWMHNRTRMIVASFLTKDLLIDWRWGEKWFMQHLIDGDPAANNGGWQWTAGTGTDAAPYFRIFNPISQSRRHDPYGDFIRKWVPELRNIADDFVHEPWQMPDELQRQNGILIGKDYPAPIVDHAAARERALVVYGKGKSS
jgi:deoxyribodipyrimidine photo-lyase